MPETSYVRTSLEIGFGEEPLPKRFEALRGREYRSVPLTEELPFEDRQFEVVLMHRSALGDDSVKEAHRVLRPGGRLCFQVPEKNKAQGGYTLAEIYALVRYGFDIVELDRPKWWEFRRLGRTISITARKKNWKQLNNTFRPLV